MIVSDITVDKYFYDVFFLFITSEFFLQC